MVLNKSGSYSSAWIGFYADQANLNPQNWAWTDGSSVTYTDWAPGWPSLNGPNIGQYESSNTVYNNGKQYWQNFYPRTQPLPYLCKQAPICGF